MNSAMTITDAYMALSYSGMPEMIVKNMPHGFVMVPFKTILNKVYKEDYESWQYAFVNRELNMYKINFESLEDLVPNPLYGKSLEQLKIEKDLMQ